MQLHGRDLKPEMSGADVHLLHTRLQLLGYDISQDEIDSNIFGGNTHEAVSSLQDQLGEAHGLEPTGEVDQATAKAINRLVYDRVSVHGERAIQTANVETELGEQLSDIDGHLRAHSSQLGQHTGTLRNVDNKLSTQTNELTQINARQGQQVDQLSSIDTELNRQTGKLTQHAVGLANLDAKLSTQTNELTQINAAQGQQITALQSIDTHIEALDDPSAATKHLWLNARGEEVAQLQADLVKLGHTIPQRELDEQVFGVGTENAVLGVQAQFELYHTGIVDAETAAAMTRALDSVQRDQHRVEGRIFLDNGLPAAGVKLQVYSRGYGGQAQALNEGTVATDAQGYYALDYDANGAAVNLEVRAVDPAGKEISLSATKYDAHKHEVFNLVAPSAVQPQTEGEYTRLETDLLAQVEELANLGQAQENEERQDLSILHRATGWDARLIALAATAAKQSEETGMNPQVLYGLYRAGLPTDESRLAWISEETVEKALERVQEAGITDLTDEDIAGARTAFVKYSRLTRRNAKAAGTLSSFGEMLEQSNLEEQAQFEEIYLTHRGSADELWRKAAEAGIPEASIAQLQLQGKLAYLTLNNGPLTTSLQSKVGSTANLVQLVEENLYRSDVWVDRIEKLAETEECTADTLIPPAYVGETEERLQAYAADLARKVRISFPTQVVRRMIEADELKLGEEHDRDNVCMFLHNAAPLDFKLGRNPVAAFVNNNNNGNEDALYAGIPANERDSTLQSVKQLQRLYQITPSDEALKTVTELGFTSAYDVTAFAKDEFLDSFGDSFPSPQQAELVYRKAQQVNAVTLNVAAMAKQLDSVPPIYSIFPAPASDPETQRTQVKQNLIKHYPTMESLFGSVDFCECQHCRSVLSPAAYLVDLLKFLDPDDGVWQHFERQWKIRHRDEAYGDQYLKPYDALIERRPDLPHLPLTCENTHTTLPYIDIVNEILEYAVANEGLDAKSVHDTGDAATEELLAEPQNVLAAAYEKLAADCYPLSLPFDLWLEMVRRFCEHFDMPLWQVLEVFRPTDELFANTGDAYGRVAIFAEYLGLSPSEYAIFVNLDPLEGWYRLYGYPDAGTAETPDEDKDGQRIDLNSAKTLSRKLDVSYKELAELVQASFVNPALQNLVPLYRLGIQPSDIFRYFGFGAYSDSEMLPEEKAVFEGRVDSNVIAQLGHALQAGDFNDALVLADPDAGCNFNETIVRHADGTPADAFDFLRLNLFVRLWKRLDWTIQEVDQALQVFIPNSLAPLTGTTIGPAFRTALVYLAHLKRLDELLKPGKEGRLKLLTLWSDLPTTERHSLYARLFLTPSLLKSDPIFDEAGGHYLRYFDDGSERYLPFYWAPGLPEGEEDVASGLVFLQNHLPAVQGALGMTADDIEQIIGPLRKVQPPILSLAWPDTEEEPGELPASVLEQCREHGIPLGENPTVRYTGEKRWIVVGEDQVYLFQRHQTELLICDDLVIWDLSVANLSLLYRHSLLAEALDLSIRELVTLKDLSGLDPFMALSAGPLETLDDDYPLTQTLRFVEMAGELKESGFGVADLDYLLRHRSDPVGEYRADPAALLSFVKALAAEIQRIQTEHAAPVDSLDLTDELLQQKLALVLPTDVVETFMGMWTSAVVYEAVAKNVPDADKLNPNDFASEPAILVRYDKQNKMQQLLYRGVLTDMERTRLKTAYPSPLLATLLDDLWDQERQFYSDNFVDIESPLLSQGDFELLFAPIPGASTDQEAEEWMRRKRAIFVSSLLPRLQQRLIRQAVAQAVATRLDADAALIDALLTDVDLLTDPSDRGGSLLSAFTSAAERGVSAIYFASTDGTGVPIESRTIPDLSEPHDIEAYSARFAGYLETPMAGAYRFFAILEATGVQVELRFDHLPEPILRGQASSNNATIDGVVNLQPGIPYHFTLDVHNLQEDLYAGGVALLVRGDTLSKGSLARLRLYPQSAVERCSGAETLLAKVMQIIQGLGLNEREVRYLLTHRADFGDLDLSRLPTSEDDSSAADPPLLFEQFQRLAGYSRLKRELAGETDDLITIFEHARRTYPTSVDASQAKADLLDELYGRMADLARREVATVQAAAGHLAFGVQSTVAHGELLLEASGFTQEQHLRRLWQVLQVVQRFGVPVQDLARWATPAPDAITAQDLKNAVKARYEPENWRRIAQSIFDPLRQRQRDALVAYAMHQGDFARMEQLYEWFLIDPGMEPMVQTSRIRLAISAVQLFIQRCLLNLERKVHPSAINSRHWQWMKRYRVWEANRKIFLYPENWLEPEFRDDKTHLFQELESALLQGDVSNELAEDALYAYLKKLESMAKLEMMTMCLEEDPHDSASNVLHVIARTHNPPYEYFYRRHAHAMWTPWEPITAQIDGDHVVAVVWRGRLHLFWVMFLERLEPVTRTGSASGQKSMANSTVGEIAENASAMNEKYEDVSLSWVEYFQGEWTARQSSDPNNPMEVWVPDDFTSKEVFIHVTKDNIEGSVKIHLCFSRADRDEQGNWSLSNKAFEFVSKNSRPKQVFGQLPPFPPYPNIDEQINQYIGENSLNVDIVTGIEHFEDGTSVTNMETREILGEGSAYSLLTCGSGEASPTDGTQAFECGFFYQNDVDTFFVEPLVSTTTLVEWRKWVITAASSAETSTADIGPIPPLESRSPEDADTGPTEYFQDAIDPLGWFGPKTEGDWVKNSRTALGYGETWIKQDGGFQSVKALDMASGFVYVGMDGVTPNVMKNLHDTHAGNAP